MNSGDELSLLMIDVDRFKRVNDTWGHRVGDELLRHLASTLQRTVRREDLVARYGGEEFAVILPQADAAAAIAVGENIRRALASVPVPLDVTPVMPPATVSIGVSCYQPGDPLSEWVGKADAALYRAKQEGRDQVRYIQ
jgi:diguanylate cyclase